MKCAVHPLGAGRRHMDLEPRDGYRHNDHEHILDPRKLEALPVLPQEDLDRCLERAAHRCGRSTVRRCIGRRAVGNGRNLIVGQQQFGGLMAAPRICTNVATGGSVGTTVFGTMLDACHFIGDLGAFSR